MANSKFDETAQAETAFVGSEHAEEMQIDGRLYRKTLTPAIIEALPERAMLAKRRTLLFRIGGEVRGTVREPLTTDLNKPEDQRTYFTALVGDFSADVYDDKTGEITAEYVGGQCYLPTGFHEQALAQFQRSCDEAVEAGINPSFRFNLEFAAEPADNPRGYRWLAQNLNRRLRGDMHDQMRQQAIDGRAAGYLPLNRSQAPRELTDSRASRS